MTQALYTADKGFNRAAICKLAAKYKADGRFSTWDKISARERWGVCMRTAWLQAKREKQRVEYDTYQADLARKIAAAEARAAAFVPSNVPVVPMTAQQMIDNVYRMAGTLD